MVERKRPKDNANCPICNSWATAQPDILKYEVFWDCPVCGRFKIDQDLQNDPRTASYLFYHRFKQSDENELRYHTTESKEYCDQYNLESKRNHWRRAHPVHVDADILANWYPETLDGRIDKILPKINELAGQIGQFCAFDNFELLALLFIKRKEPCHNGGQSQFRDYKQCSNEVDFVLDSLQKKQLVEIQKLPGDSEHEWKLRLTHGGLSRVDALQEKERNSSEDYDQTKADQGLVIPSAVFSNEYLNQQCDILLAALSSSPSEAIGKSKELLESCCKTILEKLGISYGKNDKVQQLAKKVLTALKLLPDDIPPNAPGADAIKQVLGNLGSITGNLAELRNAFGSGHGRPDSFRGLEKQHAKLAVRSSFAFSEFVWDAFEKEQNHGSGSQKCADTACKTDQSDD